MREYLPILIMILVGIGLAGVFTAISILFGPKLSTETKQTPFESGFLTQGTEGQRYDVKFFMTALVSSFLMSKSFFSIPGQYKFASCTGPA